MFIKIFHYAKMDRNPIKGGVSFTEYTFILGVELRSVCFDGVGVTMTVTDLSKGLVETGTTRSRGILKGTAKFFGGSF